MLRSQRRRLLPSLSLRRRPKRTNRSLPGLQSARSVLIAHIGDFADIQATPVDDESENGDDYDVPAPKKKARTPARSVSPQPPKISKPLGEANDNIADDERKIEEPFKVMKPLIIKKKSKATLVDDDEEEVQPEKKKKRKLLGVQPAFQWDSIMNVSRLSSHGIMLMGSLAMVSFLRLYHP